VVVFQGNNKSHTKKEGKGTTTTATTTTTTPSSSFSRRFCFCCYRAPPLQLNLLFRLPACLSACLREYYYLRVIITTGTNE
jgi:hypothetical protein